MCKCRHKHDWVYFWGSDTCLRQVVKCCVQSVQYCATSQVSLSVENSFLKVEVKVRIRAMVSWCGDQLSVVYCVLCRVKSRWSHVKCQCHHHRQHHHHHSYITSILQKEQQFIQSMYTFICLQLPLRLHVLVHPGLLLLTAGWWCRLETTTSWVPAPAIHNDSSSSE